jgi:hypothetical protein
MIFNLVKPKKATSVESAPVNVSDLRVSFDSKQYDEDQYQKYDPYQPARPVTPSPAVGPRGNCSKQQQHKEYD